MKFIKKKNHKILWGVWARDTVEIILTSCRPGRKKNDRHNYIQ